MKSEKKYINKLFIIQGILTLFVLFDYWRFFNRNIVGVAFFFFVLLTFFSYVNQNILYAVRVLSA